MSKRLFGLRAHCALSVLSLVVLLGLVACGDLAPIRVGYIGELSGRRSEIGVAVRNGVQLMVDQTNAAGGVNGRMLELEIHDNKGDIELCRSLLNGMIAGGVQFIVGPVLSQMAEVTMESIEGKDVLVMSPTMSTDLLSGKDDNLVRTSATTTQQARLLTDVLNRKSLKSVAVVYDLSNSKYTELLYTSFRDDAKKFGISIPVVLTIAKTNQPEMLPLAQKLIAAKPDGILMCLSAIDAANLSQQVRKLGYSAQLIGVSWSQTDDLIQHGGKAVEGMLAVSTTNYGAPPKELIVFREQYKARYKEIPSFAAGRGYEAMGLFAEAMKRAAKVTPTEVKKAILGISDYPGFDGVLQLDEFGDSLSGYSMVKVENGKFVAAD